MPPLKKVVLRRGSARTAEDRRGDLLDPPVPDGPPRRCRPGEIWGLGPHRLAVGSSTDPDLVARLFGKTRCRMVWTDPPYGVSYANKNEYLNAADKGNRCQQEIAGDHLTPEATEALARAALTLACAHSEPGGACYVCAPGGPLYAHFLAAFSAAGYSYRQMLVWVKSNFVLGQSDYHYRHEPILYGWKPGAGHYFISQHGHGSVFEVAKPHSSKDHPTMKPVALVMEMIRNSARFGEVVYDPFLGSGTTLLAAERLGRVCYGCELDERYADTVLARYQEQTGTEPGVLTA